MTWRLCASTILLVLALAAPASADEPVVPAGYALHRSLPLDKAASGIDGALQIVEDSRIGPALRAEMWLQTNDTDLILAAKDPLRASLARKPLLPAHLRLADGAGQILADEPFDVPLADIEAQVLHDGAPTFLVSADHSVGMGSYAGLETTLVEVVKGKLVPVALPGRTALTRSLKNDWKIVADPTPGSRDKIIQVVACRPNYANPTWAATGEFVVDLTSYRFADGAWHDKSQSFVGYWESDEDWPDDRFP
ncbi:MAG TPA: hypothetical protein VGV37_18320 [Aliidongia sp.]|uniref:hypothetical protein n=1 Tax=Aliidongia sp. TaxID=1914230 RepID=UPI002DDCB837|nr:hypothetical protein [Aliidongia sp.]HEV2676489.1 hypothetical protein [Aliidongia sp.]